MIESELAWLGQQLLRGLILLGIAWPIALGIRSGPCRYVFWRGVFVILLAMVIVGLGPALRYVEIRFDSRRSEGIAATMTPPQFEDGTEKPTAGGEPGKAFGISIAPDRPGSAGIAVRWLPLLFWIWIGGAGLGLSRLIVSWWCAWIVIRRAERYPGSGDAILETDAIATPLTFGVFRPRILVPSGFSKWTATDRRMVLRHELAHARNRDGAWQMLATVVAVLHWPNPLVWLALRQLEGDRELNADAQVIRSGVSARSYSELLVRLASSRRTPRAALSMARKSTIPKRVDRILRGGEAGNTTLGPVLWLALGLVTGVALTLGVTSLVGPDPDRQIDVVTRFVEVEPERNEESPGPAEDGFEMREFLVPPDFLRADDGASGRRIAKGALEEMGIVFPEGSTAVYNAASHKVIVRNTPTNLDLTGAALEGHFVETAKSRKQVFLTSKIVEIPRTGDDFSRVQNTTGAAELAGVFTDPQFQVVIRAFNQRKDVDLLSVPSVMARSGQRAFVEMGEVRVIDVTPVIGPDGFTIDLNFHQTPSGDAMASLVTIWDGQTVAFTEPAKDGRLRAVFVTARIIDPAGVPVHGPDEHIREGSPSRGP